MNFYKVHNLIITSQINLPELVPVDSDRADVKITEGLVPLTLSKDTMIKEKSLYEGHLICEVWEDNILLLFHEIGRLLIEGTDTITFERDIDVGYDSFRTYLLGSGLGFLLLKRGIFPFHGSSVITPFGAVLFVAPSGWGKSTTAAKFFQEGHTLLTDDVCVVQIKDQDIPYAYPSSHRLKLWEDSVDALDFEPELFFEIMPDFDKKQVYLKEKHAKVPQPLTVIYQLWPDEVERVEILPLQAHEKLAVIANNTYRMEGVELLNLKKEHFEFCDSIARLIPVKRLSRPTASFDIDELYSLVMEDLRTINESGLVVKNHNNEDVIKFNKKIYN